jgi:hypothetical protein
VGEEEESLALRELDPKEWKTQDHYAMLGLSGLRWRATDEQIKIARACPFPLRVLPSRPRSLSVDRTGLGANRKTPKQVCR